MTYKLNPKLIPFLIKEKGTDKLMAKLVSQFGQETIVQLDEGVTAKLNSKDLGVKMGKSISGKLYFDEKGTLLSSELTELPKQEQSTRQGCSTKQQVPQFK